MLSFACRWALGAILYEMVMGIPPFNASTPEEIFDNILDRSITWPEDEEDMTPECRDLIDKLLNPNPVKRLGHRGAGEQVMFSRYNSIQVCCKDNSSTKQVKVRMRNSQIYRQITLCCKPQCVSLCRVKYCSAIAMAGATGL
jgi:serine/threonine protein kinase